MSDEYLNPRRQFLRQSAFGFLAGTSVYLIGCNKPKALTPTSSYTDIGSMPVTAPTSASKPVEPEIVSAPAQCMETASNIEGPYYRPGSPERNILVDDKTPGTRFMLTGQVWGLGCQAPLGNAKLDFWQATHDGHYDIDGTMSRSDIKNFIFRGKQKADGDGKYSLTTVIPGNYLNGEQYRPAHIHVKVSAPGYQTLTTQLYFDGDPYNDIDPFIDRSLIMPMKKDSAGKKSRFDFILIPA
jgi:protocatechuate 3,4-dioxygenase beta subunit